MVDALIKFIKRETNSLHEAAFLLGLFAFLSQILALVRDKLLAHNFGAGSELDVYYAAFRIPDFIFVTIGSIVSLSILVPFIISVLDKGQERASKFINTIFTCFLVVIVSVCVVIFFFTPTLVKILFGGFSPENVRLTTELSRILLLSPILLGISNLFGSLAQSRNRFLVFAISPLLYNCGIIIGIIFLLPTFGVQGLVWGVILGALLHLLVQFPTISELNLVPRLAWKVNFSQFKEVLVLAIPRTLALSISHLTILFLLSLASSMGEGSISVFNLAWNIQSVPLSIFGVSYSLAAFPHLSKLYLLGEKDKFIDKFLISAKHIIFWILPCATLFVVLRAHIVRVVLGSGQFDWADTRLTAAVLALFAISLVFQAVVLLCVRALYAAGSTARPFYISIMYGIVVVFFAFLFKNLFTTIPAFKFFFEALFKVSDLPGTRVLSLPLAFTVGSIFEAVLLWLFFAKSWPQVFFRISKTIFQIFSSSVILGFVTYLALRFFDRFISLDTFAGVFLQAILSAVVGIFVWVIMLLVLKNKEFPLILATLREKFWKTHPTSPDSTIV
jgi:putative peptidoglycan lipid II flippase